MIRDKADRLMGQLGDTRVAPEDRAAVTRLLARRGADDLTDMLGLDQIDPDGEPAEKLHPQHHTMHVGRIGARRVA